MDGRELCVPATERDTGERPKNEGNTVVHPYVAAGAEGRGVRLQDSTRGGGRVPLGLLTTSSASVLQGGHPAAQKEEGGGLTPPPYLFDGTYSKKQWPPRGGSRPTAFMVDTLPSPVVSCI